jgi:TPR repeat protein
LAMLITVQICHAEPIKGENITELTDGIWAYALDRHTEAVRLLYPLAKKGQPLAQLFLGRTYIQSNSIPRDCRTGVNWLVQAANQGNADAAFDLAGLFMRGECVAPDETIALNWYKKAAEQGHPEASLAVGELYLGGENLATNYPAALNWFRRAVKHFDRHAAYHIGMIYEQGLGIRTDYKEAFKWFHLSYLLSRYDESDRILIARDRVREQLMPAQVAEAAQSAKELLITIIEQPDDKYYGMK